MKDIQKQGQYSDRKIDAKLQNLNQKRVYAFNFM